MAALILDGKDKMNSKKKGNKSTLWVDGYMIYGKKEHEKENFNVKLRHDVSKQKNKLK